MPPLFLIGAGALIVLALAKAAQAAEESTGSRPDEVPPPVPVPLPEGPQPRPPKKKVTDARAYSKLSTQPLVSFTLKRVQKKKTGKKAAVLTYVVETPAALKAQAETTLKRPIEDSAFVLATMVASETGGLHPLAKVGVAHAAWNAAKREGLHIPELVLRPSNSFAGQTVNGYASTKSPPSLQDLTIAEDVLDGTISDPTYGATQWDSPALQDRLHASGDPMHRSSEEIARDRTKTGSVPVYLAGIDKNKLRFWRPSPKKALVS